MRYSMKAAVYCGTRNLYDNMLIAAKSLLIHSDVDQIYFLIEDDTFPCELPPEITCLNISQQTYFKPDGPNFNSSWTYMVLIRAALSKIFPHLDTILSLDVDTIINENISSLWDIDLDNYYLAAVPEPEKTQKLGFIYINMGVALFNLKKIRETHIDDKIINALNTQFYEYNEQDCISQMCQGYIKCLPSEYNVCNYTAHEVATIRKITHFAAIKHWQNWPQVKKYNDLPIVRNQIHSENKLDIIIPTYNNAKALIRTLESIQLHSLIDITVVNDCSTKDIEAYQALETQYPKINFLWLKENSGPGMARQYGLEHTNNPYIMFIDAGDYIISNYNLIEIIDTINNNRMPYLYLWRWLNEENHEYSSENNPLLHGWVYSREFLNLYNITFSREGSYLNEDVGFNRACQMVINHIKQYDDTCYLKFIETPIYMYTYDRNSITHLNNKEFFYTKQTKALTTNSRHALSIALRANLDTKIIIEEVSAIMVGLYIDFLHIITKHPEYAQDNWNNIRAYYLDTFKPYESKSTEAIRNNFSQRIRTILRASTSKTTPPANIKRFLIDLNSHEIIPQWYYGG